MERLLHFFLLAVVVTSTTLGVAGSARAHGHREVGEHEWTVGWTDEPAFVGFKNAVQLTLAHHGGDQPVEGAEKGLEVVVSIGGRETEPLELRTVFDSPGEYRADLIPTVPGDYTFRFTGTLEGEEIDQSFTASKDDFSQIEGTSDVTFPKAAPSNAELAERIETAEANAQDALGMPRILGIAGIALGALALIVGARSRKASA